MARLIVLEEFHLTLLIPKDLSARRCREIRQTLSRESLQKSVCDVIRKMSKNRFSLSFVRLRISQ